MSPHNELANPVLKKAPTGIAGFDEISNGGLPFGRPSLVCGRAGSGKTLFGVEFLVRGIIEFNEPGVFIAFEETREEITQNVASLGFSLKDLIDQNMLVIDHISIDQSELKQTGEYDLDGLFIRLDYAIQKISAKRIIIDTLEVLFAALDDTQILRAELRRLFRWLKDKGITAVITGESGEGLLTRHGIEEYVSDCVILLDRRIENRLTTRFLRIVKYRGTVHGSDEYPFIINESGFSVLPITAVGLDYTVSEERILTGIPRLDIMLDGQGFYRTSTILISGQTGTGKTTIASQFIDAACRRGERCIYFSFEESASQIIRNMRSVGIDLQVWVDANLLHFWTVRPTMYSLEKHLTLFYKQIETYKPQVIIMDPVTNFDTIGNGTYSRDLLTRLIDYLKMRGITAILTSLIGSGNALEQSGIHISSMMDAWLLVKNVDSNGERNRVLYIIKSRGMPHSNQVSEFEITPHGIQLVDAYLGRSGILTGSARLAQEAVEKDEELAQQQALKLRKLQSEQKRISLEAQIAALQAELAVESTATQLFLDSEKWRNKSTVKYNEAIANKRQITRADNESPININIEEDTEKDD